MIMSSNRRQAISVAATVLSVSAVFILCAGAGKPAVNSKEKYLSPADIVADQSGETLYIAAKTAGQVAVLDVGSLKVTKTISIPARPSGLALSPDGSKLYVTGGDRRRA